MEAIGVVASIVTLVALAKEISNVAKDLLQGYVHAPKELVQLSGHISLIALELECLHRLQCATDLESCLTDEESWMLKEALTLAKSNIIAIKEKCAQFVAKRAAVSTRVSWVLFDSKTAEVMLAHIERTENHLIFILQILNMCRTSRAQIENDRQMELLRTELRAYHDQVQKSASLHRQNLQNTDRVADVESSLIFRHKYTTSINALWKRWIPCDFSWTTSGNDFQAAHELYLRLPILTPRGRMAFVFSVSLRRSLGYLSNISILGGGLKCFNIVPVESDIVAACLQGDVLLVRTLFDQGKASPCDMSTEHNRTLIYYASRSGSTELVRFLISVGAPVQSDQLFATAFWRNPRATRLLLQNGAGLDVLGKNGYTFATFLYGKSRPRIPQTELIDILAEKSFPYFNTQESNGWTVMHRAAAWGTAADIQALRRSKASAEFRSYRLGWIPIFLAVCYKNMDTLQELWNGLPNETCRDQRDFRGWNLLHIAVCYDNFEAVKWLLEKGVSMDTRGEATSSFVPPLLRGKAFSPGELAQNCGEEAYTKWAKEVQDSGRDVGLRPEEIDWSQEETDGFFPLCECCDQWVVPGTSR